VATILVVNAGSSSVKFQVFAIGEAGGLRRELKGQVEGIGTRPRLRASDPAGRPVVDRTFGTDEVASVPTALQVASAWLRTERNIEPIAVGHRVVHGGPKHRAPTLVDRRVLADLERFVSLAPLHQPNNLAPIRVLLERAPLLPQVACFDTAFHRGHGPAADRYAIPEPLYAEGVRRYGFHGLSYEYVAGRLIEIAPEVALGRVIVAHLGSGASMCALSGGRSVESTMGFTALDGLPMGTRPGEIDPGVVLYLLQEKGLRADEVQDLLYRDCGLKALSGISNDMRELETSVDPRAAFAIEYFEYRVGLYAGMLAAALGGLDAFVFTGGIGENSVRIREGIAHRVAWLGAKLDTAANAAARPMISRRDSTVALYVVPTDEELMIARHTLALISTTSSKRSGERDMSEERVRQDETVPAQKQSSDDLSKLIRKLRWIGLEDHARSLELIERTLSRGRSGPTGGATTGM
jgi:acetate kinase